MEKIVKKMIQDWSGVQWETENFRKRLSGWLKDNLDEDDKEDHKDIAQETGGVIPDLFRFEEKKVCILEIEDTSRLTEAKLWQYCWLWNALDTYGIKLQLLVTDRYGVNPTELPLMEFYYSFTAQQVAEKAELNMQKSPSSPPSTETNDS